MEKPAVTDHPIHGLLARRWSPIAFADRAIEPETLASLFEAARWAPSSYNEQPWSYVVGIRGGEDFDRLLGCVVEANAAWAREAPALILSVAKTTFDRNGKANRHAYHDVGLATANLVIQATSMGLFAHQMAGFDADKAQTDLEIPEGHEAVAMMALGYPGELESLPESMRARESAARSRKPQSDFVFAGRWGKAVEA